MKSRFHLWTLGLLAVLSASSCAPAVGAVEPPAVTAPALTPALPRPVLQTPASAVEGIPTEAPTDIVRPVATSRGPDLEATDPTTVRLDSGGLQLVEFFRFT